jgi:hypothetical protein
MENVFAAERKLTTGGSRKGGLNTVWLAGQGTIPIGKRRF